MVSKIHQEFRSVPKMKAFRTNLMWFGYFGGGEIFVSIMRDISAFMGEDSSILGTNEMFGERCLCHNELPQKLGK